MGYVQLMCMEPTSLKLKYGVKNNNLDVDKKYFSASYYGTLGNFVVNYNLSKDFSLKSVYLFFPDKYVQH